MPLWEGCQLIMKFSSVKRDAPNATLNASPPLILGCVRGNFYTPPHTHTLSLFRIKLMWHRERKAHCAAARGMGGRAWGQREERQREGGNAARDELGCKGKDGCRGERKGEMRGWGGGDRELGVHANFIILLINFSSGNPPTGTTELIEDSESKPQLLSNIQTSVHFRERFSSLADFGVGGGIHPGLVASQSRCIMDKSQSHLN